MKIISETYTDGLYDQSEKAYILENTRPDHPTPCKFILEASGDSPVFNPEMIIKNWAGPLPRLSIHGQEVSQGMEFRQGIRKGACSHDLIVWIQLTSKEPVKGMLE